jgi:hypothetical protein
MMALAGLVALVLAVLTGSTPLAMLVIALAVIGIVMLLRNWRDERRDVLGRESGPSPGADLDGDSRRTGPPPDEFSPDISGDPDGPSSDARAD